MKEFRPGDQQKRVEKKKRVNRNFLLIFSFLLLLSPLLFFLLQKDSTNPSTSHGPSLEASSHADEDNFFKDYHHSVNFPFEAIDEYLKHKISDKTKRYTPPLLGEHYYYKENNYEEEHILQVLIFYPSSQDLSKSLIEYKETLIVQDFILAVTHSDDPYSATYFDKDEGFVIYLSEFLGLEGAHYLKLDFDYHS